MSMQPQPDPGDPPPRPRNSESSDSEVAGSQPKDLVPKDCQPKDSEPKDSEPKDTVPKDSEPKDRVPSLGRREIKENDPKYHFSEEMNAGCEAMCNGTLPAFDRSSLVEKAGLQESIEALLRSSAEESENFAALASFVVAVGAEAKVKLVGSQERHRIVPFIAVELPATAGAPMDPVTFQLGIFFPDAPGFAMKGVRQRSASLTNQSQPSALALAVRWMELLERVHAYSPEIFSQSIRLVYEGKPAPLLRAATGREVLLEVSTRRLNSLDRAHARCLELGIEVSKIDFCSDEPSGSEASSPGAASALPHFEDSRVDYREVADRYSRVAKLLGAKRFKLFHRYSVDAAHAKDPETRPAMLTIQEGMRTLKLVEIGAGAPIVTLIEGAETSLLQLLELHSSRAGKGLEALLGEPIEQVAEYFNSSLGAMRKIDSLRLQEKGNQRAAYLNAVALLTKSEQSYVSGVRLLRRVLDRALPEQDQDSFNDGLLRAYTSALNVLRSIREQINRAFPDLFAFKENP